MLAEIANAEGGLGAGASLVFGYDTDNGKFFIDVVGGGSPDPFVIEPEQVGLQLGGGFGFGFAESRDFITAPAYTADIDLLIFSASASSNDPIITDYGYFQEDDSKPRQLTITFGPGLGISQTKTQGKKLFTFELPSIEDNNSEIRDDLIRKSDSSKMNLQTFTNGKVTDNSKGDKLHTCPGTRLRKSTPC